jgi:hypothetical protein
MRVGDAAAAVGKGLVAGAVGTAALTATQLLAQRFAGQQPSSAPADAAEQLAGVQPEDEQAERRLTTVVHGLYGTAWGVPRGLLGLVGVSDPAATALHFLAVWGTALGMLPGLKIAPPPTRWDRKELALDAGEHLVYVVATSAAYTFLDRRSVRARLAP